MSNKLMILPAHDYNTIRLVKIPEDYEDHEVFRHVTGSCLFWSMDSSSSLPLWLANGETTNGHHFFIILSAVDRR